MASAFVRLERSKHTSDLTILCEGRKYPVRKSVVCRVVKAWAIAVDEQWKESTTGVIEHVQFDVSTLDRFLEWIYYNDYSSTIVPLRAAVTAGQMTTLEAQHQQVLEHLQVVAIADYYDVKQLKSLAEKRFTESLKATRTLELERVGVILVFADEYLSANASIWQTLTKRMRDDFKHLTGSKASMKPIWEDASLIKLAHILSDYTIEQLILTKRNLAGEPQRNAQLRRDFERRARDLDDMTRRYNEARLGESDEVRARIRHYTDRARDTARLEAAEEIRELQREIRDLKRVNAALTRQADSR